MLYYCSLLVVVHGHSNEKSVACPSTGFVAYRAANLQVFTYSTVRQVLKKNIFANNSEEKRK